MSNIILDTDSYKASHWKQYPPTTETVFSYIESRGGDHSETMFFGLQAWIKEYLMKPISTGDIKEAKEIFAAHGEPFNEEDWVYIRNKYAGNLPVKIRAIPEGMVVPVSNVLVTVENTDPRLYWLTSYLETAMLRAVWYPTTVATVSRAIRKNIKAFLDNTADSSDGLAFKLHDFGARGVSSKESAGLGGMSHLATGAMGTDTIEALLYARKYYNADMPAYSIPAAEHSTITVWGRGNELDAYRNMLNQYAKDYPIIAVVSDSYNIYNAVEVLWGEELRQEIINSGATVVIRPDSGNPAEVVLETIRLLANKFGTITNTKGYEVLNNVRVIQGDGINEQSINDILILVTSNGYSADNIAFGMGGALLQHMNRDTQKFAMKASAAKIDGKWTDVYKDPITDTGKRSKRGRITLVKDDNNGYRTVPVYAVGDQVELLEDVFENGKLIRDMSFDQVRENAKL
jgi:nicotinamide phosphoribosyltransferase